jgi:hypothetical protein
MICDYCTEPAAFRATSATKLLAVMRQACRGHVDQARTDCAVVCPPTIIEVGRRGGVQ